MITGRPDDAGTSSREAERAAEVDGEDGRFLLGFASTVRPWRARLRGNAPEAVELARRALSLLPEGDAFATTPPSAWGTRSGASAIWRRRTRLTRRPPRSAVHHACGKLAGMVMHAKVRAEQAACGSVIQHFVRDTL